MRKASKISPFYKEGDIKYYWRVHCRKMREMWEEAVTYPRFYDRLKRWWVLKKAIYTPQSTKGRQEEKDLLRDVYRRHVVEFISGDIDISPTLDELIHMNRIQMPKPKPSFWKRLKRWFSRKREK